MKKYLLSMGIALSFAVPLIGVISCSKSAKPVGKDKDTQGKGGDSKTFKFKNGEYTVYENVKDRGQSFGLENYKNPGATNSNNLNSKENKMRQSTGQAYSPHFHPRDILGWDPQKYEEGDYVRSLVPLAKREFAIENITNTKNNARFYAVDTMRKDTSASVVGTLPKGDKESQIMQGLQYMTDMIAFGGSSGEGLVYIPRAQDIDAYHRMGIKVHACLFFATPADGGSPQNYQNLIGTEPEKAANQLIKMAKYYGFDGWFINDESFPPNNWVKFMKIWHKKAKKAGIEISYYQPGNKSKVYSAGSDAYDVWFNNYGEKQGEKVSVFKKDKDGKYLLDKDKNPILDHNEFVLPKGFKATTNPLGFLPTSIETGKGKTFWTYREWENGSYYRDEDNVRTFYNGDYLIHDPRKSTKSGMAYYYREYTPFVKHNSFSTSFNKGEGDFFNVDGTTIESKFFDAGYSNMSLQDYLPTWKYVVDVARLDGTVEKSRIGNPGITIDHKETKDAWFGSNALVYNGTIKKNKMITNKLFASNIKLEEKDNFSIMYKGDVVPSLAVWTKEGNNFKSNILDGKMGEATFSNKYHRVVYDLSSLKGKQMTSFGIALKNKNSNKLVLSNFVLGKMSFNALGEAGDKALKINNLTNGGEWVLSKTKNVRLKWSVKNKGIKGYFVYKNNKDFTNRELIGITNTPATTIKGLEMEKTTYVSLIPFDNCNNLFSEIKIKIKGDKLDFSDDSKWSQHQLKTNDYGIETGHGFIGKALDGNGGVYLINDQIQVVHIAKNGTLEKNGYFKKTIFKGKTRSGKHKNKKGATLGAIFVSKKQKIFITKRYSGNGLYVFEGDMRKTGKNWEKYQINNSIFNGKDSNGELEYIAKIFEQKDESIILISSLGNIKRIKKDGILDEKFSKKLVADNKSEFKKISAIKIGSKTIINFYFEDKITRTLKGFEKEITSDGKISDSNFNIGYVLYKRELRDKIILCTTQLVESPDNHNKRIFEVVIKIYDRNKKEITKTKNIFINEEYMSEEWSDIKTSWVKAKKHSKRKILLDLEKNYDNSFILSPDGKHLIFRETDIDAHSGGRPETDSFISKNAYILVLDINKVLEDSTSPISTKGVFVKNSIIKDFGIKKYGGDFKVMIPIGDFIYYGTSDFGRIGAIKVDYKKIENTSLVRIKDTIYMFSKSNGHKVKMAIVKTFKEGKMPINPTKNGML